MATKLVRDRIREAGFQECGLGTWRQVHSHAEHLALILKKIHEELGELIEAIGTNLRTGVTSEELIRRISVKHDWRGGFADGLVWEHP